MPNNPGVVSSVCTKWSKGTGGPSGSEHFNLIAQPIGYRWQNNRDGLQQDDAVAAMRASTGGSGFHEMNHPVVVQPVPFTKAKRAQSVTDDETWVDGQVNPTLSLFDQGDTRATTVAVGFNWQNGGGYGNANEGLGITVEGTGPLQRCNTPAVAFQQNTRDELRYINGDGKIAGALAAEAGMKQQNYLAQAMTVRRLTPRECERLQGFPDDYTLIPWRKKQAEDCPDGPRYKALGNSMAVNCMAWIGERIAALENNR
jgi:site-specific DNA-cytosine methylase